MNKICLPDTNYFIRYFLWDNEQQALEAEKVLRQYTCYLSDIVAAEVIYTLENYYNYNKKDSVETLMDFVNAVNFLSSEYLLQALNTYLNSNISFYDSLILEQAKSQKLVLKTFDKKLQRVSLKKP